MQRVEAAERVPLGKLPGFTAHRFCDIEREERWPLALETAFYCCECAGLRSPRRRRRASAARVSG